MTTNTVLKRESSLDFLRMLACFMVVLLHVSADRWASADVNGSAWKAFNFYDTACRSCVPLFFLMSGKLFLSKKEMPSISVLFSKYIWKLILMYVFWGLLYAVDKVGFDRLLAGDLAAIFKSFATSPKVHLWYLPSLAGIYFLLPVYWAVAKYNDGQYLGYGCLMFFVMGILWNTVRIFVPADHALVTLFSRFSYALSGHSGYFLLGYWLSKKDFSRIRSRYCVLAFIILIIAAAKIGEWDAIQAGKPKGLLYSNLALPACAEAVLLYIAFIRHPMNLSAKMTKVVSALSRCTLFVYLSHIFVLEHLEIWFGLHTESFAPIVSVPVIALLVYGICFALAYVMLKIPVLNKWLL